VSKFAAMLERQAFSLVVSLPVNSLDAARAAIQGGADALKVHINVEHRASGNTFGTLAENEDMFRLLIREYQGPLGVVPGDSVEKVSEKEVHALAELGFDYLSLYAHTAPPWVLNRKDLGVMIACAHQISFDEIAGFSSLPLDVLEASVIPPEGYGQPLTVRDLLQYRVIADRVQQPVIVPTQRRIRESDLVNLMQTGVKGVMIGAIVTGTEPEDIYQATKRFRQTISDVCGTEG
jgi:hypothetical protein